jgi:hypothetical protein
MPDRLFRDRRDAGRFLAGLLEKYRGRLDVIVMGSPRNGSCLVRVGPAGWSSAAPRQRVVHRHRFKSPDAAANTGGGRLHAGRQVAGRRSRAAQKFQRGQAS